MVDVQDTCKAVEAFKPFNARPLATLLPKADLEAAPNADAATDACQEPKPPLDAMAGAQSAGLIAPNGEANAPEAGCTYSMNAICLTNDEGTVSVWGLKIERVLHNSERPQMLSSSGPLLVHNLSQSVAMSLVGINFKAYAQAAHLAKA